MVEEKQRRIQRGFKNNKHSKQGEMPAKTRGKGERSNYWAKRLGFDDPGSNIFGSPKKIQPSDTQSKSAKLSPLPNATNYLPFSPAERTVESDAAAQAQPSLSKPSKPQRLEPIEVQSKPLPPPSSPKSPTTRIYPQTLPTSALSLDGIISKPHNGRDDSPASTCSCVSDYECFADHAILKVLHDEKAMKKEKATAYSHQQAQQASSSLVGMGLVQSSDGTKSDSRPASPHSRPNSSRPTSSPLAVFGAMKRFKRLGKPHQKKESDAKKHRTYHRADCRWHPQYRDSVAEGGSNSTGSLQSEEAQLLKRLDRLESRVIIKREMTKKRNAKMTARDFEAIDKVMCSRKAEEEEEARQKEQRIVKEEEERAAKRAAIAAEAKEEEELQNYFRNLRRRERRSKRAEAYRNAENDSGGNSHSDNYRINEDLSSSDDNDGDSDMSDSGGQFPKRRIYISEEERAQYYRGRQELIDAEEALKSKEESLERVTDVLREKVYEYEARLSKEIRERDAVFQCARDKEEQHQKVLRHERKQFWNDVVASGMVELGNEEGAALEELLEESRVSRETAVLTCRRRVYHHYLFPNKKGSQSSLGNEYDAKKIPYCSNRFISKGKTIGENCVELSAEEARYQELLFEMKSAIKRKIAEDKDVLAMWDKDSTQCKVPYSERCIWDSLRRGEPLQEDSESCGAKGSNDAPDTRYCTDPSLVADRIANYMQGCNSTTTSTRVKAWYSTIEEALHRADLRETDGTQQGGDGMGAEEEETQFVAYDETAVIALIEALAETASEYTVVLADDPASALSFLKRELCEAKGDEDEGGPESFPRLLQWWSEGLLSQAIKRRDDFMDDLVATDVLSRRLKALRK